MNSVAFYCLKNCDICHLLISALGVKIAHDILCESDSCHLLISGLGLKIAFHILCESDGCHCKLP